LSFIKEWGDENMESFKELLMRLKATVLPKDVSHAQKDRGSEAKLAWVPFLALTTV
jgi:hypothetical protein